jgi:putative peptidoglycan lipid II flippase
MVPVFYALDDTRIPVLGSFLTVGANLLFIHLTLGPLQHRAIALSTSLSVVVNCLFLALVLYRKLSGFPVRGLMVKILKVAGASVIMGLAVSWVHGWASVRLGPSLGAQALNLAGVICLGLAFYVIMVSRLHIPEFQELMQHVRSKFTR